VVDIPKRISKTWRRRQATGRQRKKPSGRSGLFTRNCNYPTRGKNWIQPAFDKVTPKIAGVVEAAIAEDIELTFEEIKKLIETK
jgi:hypothetical protein